VKHIQFVPDKQLVPEDSTNSQSLG